MTPLFTLTTPNGKFTIEGYDIIKCDCLKDKIERFNCKKNCDFFGIPLIDLNQSNFRFPDITEEQAKEWGYEDMKWCKIAIWNESRDEGMNEVSNILLIVIEE